MNEQTTAQEKEPTIQNDELTVDQPTNVESNDESTVDESVEEPSETEKKKRGRRGKSSDLKDKIAELEAGIVELKDKNLRLYAEFENFRKRTAKEKREMLATAGKDVIKELLPVLDDFDRARGAIETAKEVDSIKEGVYLVHDKLGKILEQKGLKTMTAKGEVFNPDFHEALTEIPAPSDDLKGKVVDEIEKGYLLGETIIRHARVVVGK